MTFFVLIYDRPKQKLVTLREFPETARAEADAFRLDAQRQAMREQLDQEIVLFQAPSRETLTRTHGSYFLTERELLERTRDAVEAS